MKKTSDAEPKKKSRRGHGEGAIFQRASDGRWTGSIDHGYINGKRKREVFYRDTQDEARREMTRRLAERDRGVVRSLDRQTVEQFLTAWLANEVKPLKAPMTFTSYESTCRLHIIPDLGQLQLAKLTPLHVRNLLRRKSEAGLGPYSVHKIRNVLRTALGRAVKWELVARNVAELVEPPKVESTEIRPWTKEEANRFLAAAKDDRLGALFSVVLAVGLRKGEALGLQWSDVDLEGRTLTIRHQLQRIKGQGLMLRATKTTKSARKIALPDQVVSALRGHRRLQLEERMFAGSRWKETAFVFTTMIGTPIEPTSANKFFDRLIEKAGLKHQRFHDQRHWCATLLLAQGVPPGDVKDLLGHSKISTTMDIYGHVLDESRRHVADVMAGILDRDEIDITITKNA